MSKKNKIIWFFFFSSIIFLIVSVIASASSVQNAFSSILAKTSFSCCGTGGLIVGIFSMVFLIFFIKKKERRLV